MTSRPRESSAWAPHALLLVVQVAFATQAVEAKIAMAPREAGGELIAPTALAMARMLGAAAFFQITARTLGWLSPTAPRDHLKLAGLSILGIALNQALFLIGLRTTSPMSAALLSVTIPIFAATLAVAARQERGSLRTFAGLAFAVGGVLWLTGIGSVDRGAIIVALNSLSYACYVVFSRRIIRRLGALTTITWLFTWGAALFAPFGARALLVDAPGWTSRGAGFVLYIVAVPTVVAYVANAWALGRTTASLVAVYVYLQPVLVALLAWLQLGQSVSPRMIGSAALILIGVTLVASRRSVSIVDAPSRLPSALGERASEPR